MPERKPRKPKIVIKETGYTLQINAVGEDQEGGFAKGTMQEVIIDLGPGASIVGPDTPVTVRIEVPRSRLRQPKGKKPLSLPDPGE